MSKYLYVLLGFVLFYSTACNKKKALVIKPSTNKDTTSIVEYSPTGNFYEQRLSQFQWLSARIRINDEGGGNLPVSISASVRIRRDSAIWVSFSPGLSIEALRLVANQQEVLLVDRINRTKSKLTYKQLSAMLGTPLSYAAFESLLLANIPQPHKFSVQKELVAEKWLESSHANVHQQVILLMQHARMSFYSAKSKLDSTYFAMECSNEKEVNGLFFPFNRLVQVNLPMADGSMQKSTYSLAFQKLVFVETPLEMPFEFPENYTWK